MRSRNDCYGQAENPDIYPSLTSDKRPVVKPNINELSYTIRSAKNPIAPHHDENPHTSTRPARARRNSAAQIMKPIQVKEAASKGDRQRTDPVRVGRRRRWICVFIHNAPDWRAKGHTHWFVCQKCLRGISRGEPDWIPIDEMPNQAIQPTALMGRG